MLARGFLSGDQASAPYTSTTGWGYDAASAPTTLSYASTTTVVTQTLGYDPASAARSLRVLVNGTLTHSYVFTTTATGDRSAVGDLLGPLTTRYGWDQADRLITATDGITPSSYAYNGDGLRLSKTVSGTAEAFTWDTAEGLPLLLQDGGTRYVLGPDGTPLESVSVTGMVLYYLHDQLGSTRGLFSSTGQNVASYTDTPYGTVSLHTGMATTPFQYAGQYMDAETGWQYLQARYYDPATMQFLSVDPLQDLTLQPYAYTTVDPLNETEPWGLASGCNGGILHHAL